MSKQSNTPGTNNDASRRLLVGIERIERIEEERRALAADIKDIKAELKSAGFDVKAINQMIKERRMTEADRREWQELCELYRASLGMLDGTPLGENARQRFTKQSRPPEADEDDEPATDSGADDTASPPPEPMGPTPEDIRAAHVAGEAAFRDGKRITDNPFGAMNPCRSAWDEGWCSCAGSDGMEIPPAFRRSPKAPDGQHKGA